MTFTLPPLPYARDALEPLISGETIDYHHGKHHQAYVSKLNELTAGTEEASKTVEEIMVSAGPGVKRNQAAQVYNHTFYWHSMKPNPTKADNPPTGKISDLITSSFGSFEEFKAKFSAGCAGHFGSGWVFLVQKTDGKLAIEQGHDAMNPLIENLGTPILACDVWEHAYYIDFRNSRPNYVAAWWSLVNWEFANKNLA